MRIVKLFIGAFMLIVLLEELMKQDIFGNDRIGNIKIGMLMVFEMWLLGG